MYNPGKNFSFFRIKSPEGRLCVHLTRYGCHQKKSQFTEHVFKYIRKIITIHDLIVDINIRNSVIINIYKAYIIMKKIMKY